MPFIGQNVRFRVQNAIASDVDLFRSSDFFAQGNVGGFSRARSFLSASETPPTALFLEDGRKNHSFLFEGLLLSTGLEEVYG